MINRLHPTNLRIGRLLLLLLPVLLVAACGPEAPPRAASNGPTPSLDATRTPTSATLPTLAVVPPALAPAASAPTAGAVATPDAAATQGDPRSLGDPNAPITVVEYSDFQ